MFSFSNIYILDIKSRSTYKEVVILHTPTVALFDASESYALAL